MLRHFLAGLFSIGLMACAEAAPPTSGESATGYYRVGSEIPESANLSRGDVPRDSHGRPYTYEGLGEPLPAFTGELAAGASFASSELAGTWTVIEVWGIWCHDSRNDAPYAAELSRELAQDPDVQFMSIHTPQNAKRAASATRDLRIPTGWLLCGATVVQFPKPNGMREARLSSPLPPRRTKYIFKSHIIIIFIHY